MCLVVVSYVRDGHNFSHSKNIPSLSRNLHTEQRNHRPVGGDEKPIGALVITRAPSLILFCPNHVNETLVMAEKSQKNFFIFFQTKKAVRRQIW